MSDIRKGEYVDIVGGTYKGDWGKVKRITSKKMKVLCAGDDDTHQIGKKHCKKVDFVEEIEKLCSKMRLVGTDSDYVDQLAVHMVKTFKESAKKEGGSKKRAHKNHNDMQE